MKTGIYFFLLIFYDLCSRIKSRTNRPPITQTRIIFCFQPVHVTYKRRNEGCFNWITGSTDPALPYHHNQNENMTGEKSLTQSQRDLLLDIANNT